MSDTMILLRKPHWRLDSPLPDNYREMCADGSRSSGGYTLCLDFYNTTLIPAAR